MRFLFLALMFALLPWCAWAGNGAPTGKHPTEISAIKSRAFYAVPTVSRAQLGEDNATEHHGSHAHLHATPDGMAGLAMPAPQALPSLTYQAIPHSPCNSCGECAMCHTLALISVPSMSVPCAQQQGLRPSHNTRFESAFTALRLKPPIA